MSDLSIEEFRAQSKSYLDDLHAKENEIARLMTENTRLRRENERLSDALEHAVFEANRAIEGMKERDGKIAELDAVLKGLLRQHRCNARENYRVGECVDQGICRCSCGLYIEAEDGLTHLHEERQATSPLSSNQRGGESA